MRHRIHIGGDAGRVVFPASAVVSLLVDGGEAGSIELAMVGRRGFVGTEILLQPEPVSHAAPIAQVQVPGSGWTVERAAVQHAIEHEPETRSVLASYAIALRRQIERQVLCNALHSVDQRVCRWLLMTSDQAGSDRFPITQVFLSEMLGVRRASVNEVQRGLRDDGLIVATTGRVEIIDRDALARRACPCYDAIISLYDALGL